MRRRNWIPLLILLQSLDTLAATYFMFEGKRMDAREALGLSQTATEDEVNQTYRKKAMQYHPDLNPGDPAAEETFKLLSQAKKALDDEFRQAKQGSARNSAHSSRKAPLVSDLLLFDGEPYNPYLVMEVSPEATTEELRIVYQTLVARYERSAQPGNGSENALRKIKHFYSFLVDPQKRRLIDQKLDELYYETGLSNWRELTAKASLRSRHERPSSLSSSPGQDRRAFSFERKMAEAAERAKTGKAPRTPEHRVLDELYGKEGARSTHQSDCGREIKRTLYRRFLDH